MSTTSILPANHPSRFPNLGCILVFIVAVVLFSIFELGLFHTSAKSLIEVRAKIHTTFPDVFIKMTPMLAAELANPKHPAPVLLDVRSKEEFEVSRLKGARLIDRDQDPAVALADVPKDAEIVVYCSVGYRSSEYARILQRNHYKNVFNLDGSIFKWANEGLPLVNDAGEAHTVHPYNAEWGQLLLPQYRADLSTLKK